MFFLLSGNEKKTRKAPAKSDAATERVKELFLSGRFPVVTTDKVEGKEISKVLGLVCCRAYDSEEAFFGMASRAVNKGAHAIVGYNENVAFHPDGSKFFSCYGTAVMFEWESEEKFGAAALLSRKRQALAVDSEPVSLDPAPARSAFRTMQGGQQPTQASVREQGLELDDLPGNAVTRQWRSQ